MMLLNRSNPFIFSAKYKFSKVELRYFISILLILCVLEILSFASFAQNFDNQSPQEEIEFPLVVESYIQFLQSPNFQLWKIAREDAYYQCMWEGQTVGINLIHFSSVNMNMDWMSLASKRHLDSYRKKDKNIGDKWFQDILSNQESKLKSDLERVKKFDLSSWNTILDSDKKEYFDVTKKMFVTYFESVNLECKKVLTSEELLESRKLEFQYDFSIGLPSLTIIHYLFDLSTEQELELKVIKHKMTPIFNMILQETNDLRIEYFKEIANILIRENAKGQLSSPDDFEKADINAAKEIIGNSEWRMKIKSNIKKQKEFATQIELKYLEIFSDIQIEKLQNLIDDSHEIVKKTVLRSKLSEDEMLLLWCHYRYIFRESTRLRLSEP
jgi:hypothetical protein